MAGGTGALGGAEGVEGAGLGNLDGGLFNAGAEEGETAELGGELLNDVVAVGEEPDAALHGCGRLCRWLRPEDACLPGLGLELADGLQLSKHDALLPTRVLVALGHCEPDLAVVLVEGWVLEGLRRFEPVFALPRLAVAGDLDIEDAAADTLDAGGLLPAEVVKIAEVIKGGLGVGSIGNDGEWLADGPGAAIGAGGEVIVARVIATDRHPGAIGQAVHGGFAELL